LPQETIFVERLVWLKILKKEYCAGNAELNQYIGTQLI